MSEQQRPGPAGQPVDQTLLGEIQSEVSGEAAPLLTFVVSNIKFIVGGVVLLVAATLGYGVWQWQENTTTRDAQIALGRILVQENGEARLKALQTFAATAPADVRSAVQLELAASAVGIGNVAEAAKAYGELAKQNPGSALGMIAVFNQADLLLREGKPKEALAALESIMAAAPEALRGLVRQQMAATAEQAGESAKAMALYEELIAPTVGGASRSATETAYYRSRLQALKASSATPATAPATVPAPAAPAQ